jgi:hypothetical protein
MQCVRSTRLGHALVLAFVTFINPASAQQPTLDISTEHIGGLRLGLGADKIPKIVESACGNQVGRGSEVYERGDAVFVALLNSEWVNFARRGSRFGPTARG